MVEQREREREKVLRLLLLLSTERVFYKSRGVGRRSRTNGVLTLNSKIKVKGEHDVKMLMLYSNKNIITGEHALPSSSCRYLPLVPASRKDDGRRRVVF